MFLSYTKGEPDGRHAAANVVTKGAKPVTAAKRPTRKQEDELTRAIWKQAEEMCIPAWATPLWRSPYCKAEG